MAAHLEKGAGPYDATELRVKEVRHLIQNGRPEKAQMRLEETATAFTEAPPLEVGQPSDTARHAGATLLNSHGKVLGELETALGDEPVGAIGDWRDALGFLDLGGTAVVLPPGMLIPGLLRALGRTFVVVATAEDQAAIIERFGAQ